MTSVFTESKLLAACRSWWRGRWMDGWL